MTSAAGTVLRTLAAASLATALVMLATSGDLGPYSPIMIVAGFYLAVFGGVIYAELATRALIRWLLKRHRQRRQDAQSSDFPTLVVELPRERA